jgi:hypothetical protein
MKISQSYVEKFPVLCKNDVTQGRTSEAKPCQEVSHVQYPLSRDEHAAMARYISSLRRQLQDVSDLFTTRYGKNSSIAEIAVKTLVSSTLLEHELLLLENSASAEETAPESLHSQMAM